ncbi:MAG TPA: selenium-dependent molybdenum cofactor biosynthesis protein YqeB [Chloroflexota bacterium]|nr:selenium-dependent molybdenum cofactor biosynthesis protein YqeB [Chloroflexota bacterium]
MRIDALVVVKGGGDLATGAAFRLCRAGFRVIVTEIPRPTCVRRTVSFAEAVYAGEVMVEGVKARLAGSIREAERMLDTGVAPVLVDPAAECVRKLRPSVLVDGIMAKTNTGTCLGDAPVVVALGPGFTAGVDCHAVVETNRGHDLGRAIMDGPASADTGVPGTIEGEAARRILRAPVSGALCARRAIGAIVHAGDVVAEVDGHAVPAQIGGVLRGLLHDGLAVTAGTKVGDVDPRAKPEHCATISDKSLAVGGGVLEAVMALLPLELAATPPERSGSPGS